MGKLQPTHDSDALFSQIKAVLDEARLKISPLSIQRYMRLLFTFCPIHHTLCDKLSWSNCCTIYISLYILVELKQAVYSGYGKQIIATLSQ